MQSFRAQRSTCPGSVWKIWPCPAESGRGRKKSFFAFCDHSLHLGDHALKRKSVQFRLPPESRNRNRATELKNRASADTLVIGERPFRLIYELVGGCRSREFHRVLSVLLVMHSGPGYSRSHRHRRTDSNAPLRSDCALRGTAVARQGAGYSLARF